jgi:hypothetical protein
MQIGSQSMLERKCLHHLMQSDGECCFDYQPCINRAAKKAVLGVADRPNV